MKSLSATSAYPTAGGSCRVEINLVCLVELVLYRCLAALAQLLSGNRPGLVLSGVVGQELRGLVEVLLLRIRVFLEAKRRDHARF
jgi:hypothetical protein